MPRTKHGRTGGRPWRRRRDHCVNDPRNTHCAWCGHWVDKTLPGTDAWGPTANHVHLLALGGSEMHGQLELMHNRCNTQHMHAAMTAARARGQRRPRTTTQPAPAPRTSRTW